MEYLPFVYEKIHFSAYNIAIKESFLSGKVKSKEVAHLAHSKSLGS